MRAGVDEYFKGISKYSSWKSCRANMACPCLVPQRRTLCFAESEKVKKGKSMYVCMYACMYVCHVCMSCMYVMYVCHVCMSCMYVMYVCLYVCYVCNVGSICNVGNVGSVGNVGNVGMYVM